MHISWARNNRSGLIRVPIAKRGNPSATRIEYRSPDPACNPYLAFSVMLAAGMRGIAEGYELPPEADANLFEMGDAELAKLGIDQLPQSLSDALRVMEQLDAGARGARRAHLRVVPAQQAQRVAGLQDPRQRRSSSTATCGRCERWPSMEHARRLPRAATARAGAHARPRRLPLEGGRRRPRTPPATSRRPAGRARSSPATTDPEGAWALCRALRKRDAPASPLLRARQRRPARRPRAARRPVRRLLPHPVPPGRARGPAAPPVLPRRRRARGPRWSSTAGWR